MKSILTLTAACALICPLTGCTLERYVSKKGFHFIEDYSTENPIGYRIDGEDFSPFFASPLNLKEDRLADETRTESSDFEIKGSAELEELVSALADAKVEGEYSSVRSTTFDVTSAYVHSFHDWSLRTAPPNTSVTVEYVYETLRLGDMDLTIERYRDRSLGTEFKIEGAGDGDLSVTWNTDEKAVISGANLIVGYKSKTITFDIVAREIGFALSDDYVCALSGVGLCGSIIDYRDDNGGEALILIQAKTIDSDRDLGRVPQGEVLSVNEMNIFGVLANVEESMKDALWDGAQSAEEGREAVRVQNATYVRVQQGGRLSISVGNDRDVLFAEFNAVGPDNVNLDVIKVHVTESP